MEKETRISRRILRNLLFSIIRIFGWLSKTYRYRNDVNIPHPSVVAVYHEEMLAFSQYFYRTGIIKKLMTMASYNHLGASIARLFDNWNCEIIYGSTSRGGKKALIQLLKKIQSNKNSAVITVDGPAGPRHKVKPGVVYLAKKANVPLYILRCSYKGLRFPWSWDKFFIPFPFSEITFHYKRIDIDNDISKEMITEDSLNIERELKKLIPNYK